MRNWDHQTHGPAAREAALAHLRRDPVMAVLIERYPPPEPRGAGDFFVDLIDSIVSQQLSVKAAAAIMARLTALFGDGRVTPEGLARLGEEELRAAGLSRAKVRAVREVAAAFVAGEVSAERLTSLSEAEFVAEITKLRGIGPWTAEMLLIFSLGRPDIFSVGDLGLRNAVARHYGVDREDRDAIREIASRWSPWRSVACHYLWKSLDNTPVQAAK